MEKKKKKIVIKETTSLRSPKKPTKEIIPSINFEELFVNINTIIEKNKDKFILVAFSEIHNYFVIAHKKQLTVKRINENSVFQPVTFEETKEFPIPFILWVTYVKEEPEFIQQMKKFNTTVMKCLPMDNFMDKIKRYVMKY
jgi:hypothetical protein